MRTKRSKRAQAKPSFQKPKTSVSRAATSGVGAAKPHPQLANDFVHIFVDDQNLFFGIVNTQGDLSFRIDFGQLLLEVSRDDQGRLRPVKSAYIAGVIPDDDSFWEIAKNNGFTVRRGYLGSNNRSKQDDAFLITDMTATLYEQAGPSTIVLVAGDADYVPPLLKATEKGWRKEIAFIASGISTALHPLVHQYRIFPATAIEHFRRS